jgi:hypothetical protein
MRISLVSGAAAAALMVGAIPQMASADTYTEATFTGQVAGGNANVTAPFTSVISQGQSFSGTFVFDNQSVPPAGSGLSNIFFSNNIPATDAFTLQLGTLSFNLSNGLAADAPYGTEYNNGAFNGFDYVSNFNFSNTEYQLQIDGGVLSVLPVDQNGNPILTDSSLINATINIGNSSLTNEKSYVPTATPVPLPGSFGTFFAALAGLALLWRRPVLRTPRSA